MEGILRCSRYSFGPNRLHYCGPDSNKELGDYIKSGATNPGLEQILKQFKTLYPYLLYIATANNIKNLFDTRVVEAYWLGNNLLEKTEVQKFHRFISDDLGIKKRLSGKEFARVEDELSRGAIPHHSFHVFNIWRRTGHENVPLTLLESMDECRISSGEITKVNGPEITVLTEPLIYANGKFIIGLPIQKTLTRSLEAEYDIEQIKCGQIVSIHWSVPCEVITRHQTETLKKYTMRSIALANETI